MSQAPSSTSNSSFSHWPTIYGFERLSLCDWPAHNACVIFLGSCNMRCPTCHNWQLAWEHETLPAFSAEDILTHIHARKDWLDGIVITGGEATCAPQLPLLLSDLKKIGLPIKVDSNGQKPAVIEHLLRNNLADAFSIDVKGPWELYPRLSGGTTSAADAEQNLKQIFALAIEFPKTFMFRMTQVPLIDEESIKIVQNYLPKGFTLTVQRFIAPQGHGTAS